MGLDMRITEKDLNAVVNRLNSVTGQPKTYGIKNGKEFKTNIGHYCLDAAYGGWKLVQVVNEGGGIKEITQSGFTSKKNLYYEIQAIISAFYSFGECG